MRDWSRLYSSIDASINHIRPTGGGHFEARYACREPETILCYLSSYSGCSMACRMCHLTATGQTGMTPATTEDFRDQAAAVFDTYDALLSDLAREPASIVNFNFMARGEPLLNPALQIDAEPIFWTLEHFAAVRGLRPVFKLSTIMPRDFPGNRLPDIFCRPEAQVYYSLYSMDADFRRRWLPRAMDPRIALRMLARLRHEHGRDVRLHWALIKGENDSEATMREALESALYLGLQPHLNIVRFNPPPGSQWQEADPDRIDALLALAGRLLGRDRVKMLSNIGPDVKAACGMFVQ